MWHEARKHEKTIQRLFNEQKKRAESRREEHKPDPDLLQINGLKSKLAYDPSAQRQEIKCLVPWQGDPKVTIDRYDIRATTNVLREPSKNEAAAAKPGNLISVLDANEDEVTKKLLRYERYRLLIKSELNGTSEDLRLKMVAESDQNADARFAKLRQNKLGTSGDASFAVAPPKIKIRMLPNRNDIKLEPGLPYSYNSQVPEFLSGSQDDGADSCSGPSESILGNIDEKLDLMKCNFSDSEKVGLITRKYGLNPDEFVVLARNDKKVSGLHAEADSRKDLMNLLHKKMASKAAESQDNNQNYGPALPPELIKKEISTSPSPGFSSPPKRHRSPTGATMQLRRPRTPDSPSLSPKTYPENLRRPHESLPRETKSAFKMISNEEIRPSTSQNTNLNTTSTQCDACISTNGKDKPYDSKSSDDSKTNQVAPSIESEPIPQRRAATPLAYKRFCRSSRSVSRERRSSDYRRCDRRSSSQDRYRKLRVRGRPSSKSSFSSIISTTSKSSDQHSIKVPRKKRRRRGGRRRGRRSSRRRR